MKLDHIAIIASDYQKALAFYGILGFQEIERVKRPFDIMGMLECDGVWIELFEKAAPARLTNRRRWDCGTSPLPPMIWTKSWSGCTKTESKQRQYAPTRTADDLPF